MPVERVTLELRSPTGWRPAATASFAEPDRGMAGPCQVEYDLDYAIDRVEEGLEGSVGLAAVATTCPVGLVSTFTKRWPGWLDDIRPGGAARRWWVARLGLTRHTEPQRDLPLLAAGAIAPVGHLRVAEAVPPKPGPPRRFHRSAVIERDHAFLEHAAELGASVGGATGAGGEAPKLSLRVAGDQVWIDTWQDEPDNTDRHYLVKFARNQRSAIDQLVLRCEHVYYLALAELGVDTIGPDGLRLEEGHREPSLWLPRFDVRYVDGREQRLGLESHFALLDAPPASWLVHEDVLQRLQALMAGQPDHDAEALTQEYLRRDLLNLVFGNPDNHGRNAAILKTPEGLRLAPVFDFAPMRLDPDGIIRTTRWRTHEAGGVVDFRGLTESLAAWGRPEALYEALRELAAQLRDLPERLRALGMPLAGLESPRLDLLNTHERLKRWGLT